MKKTCDQLAALSGAVSVDAADGGAGRGCAGAGGARSVYERAAARAESQRK